MSYNRSTKLGIKRNGLKRICGLTGKTRDVSRAPSHRRSSWPLSLFSGVITIIASPSSMFLTQSDLHVVNLETNSLEGHSRRRGNAHEINGIGIAVLSPI